MKPSGHCPPNPQLTPVTDSVTGKGTPRSVEQEPRGVNLPLPELRGRLGQLPRDREIQTICRPRQRACDAKRLLPQNGFAARTISGGRLSHATLSGRMRNPRATMGAGA